ncbi:MAG: bifunctional YncE family protein/alkaline phosphatase family protein [Isosphaeraceae bacterium]|nr:bifunctional YncE family protein/alkaline phosphatase family protein [Isosphaeraceae bacterium]
MLRPTRALAVAVTLTATLALPLLAQDQPRYAGRTERGFLLPNGWTITPAGDQVILTDLPLNIIPLADGRHALVATSGFNAHELSLVDLVQKKVVAKETVRQSWYGLALDEKAGKVWWSGGGGNRLHTFDLKGTKLVRTSEPEPEPSPKSQDELKAARKAGRQPEVKSKRHFKSGLRLDPEGKLLYSLDIEAGILAALDPKSGESQKEGAAGTRPYDVVPARNGSRLYVSDWAGRSVLALDPDDLRVVAKIPVGEHPNQIAVHPKDDRIFVACASSNSVSVIDTRRGVVTETIATALFPNAPEGSTPDALAVSPDGQALYVANADNNCIAVIDIATPNRSQVKGFIPTGWYPTAVAVTPDGKTLLVGVGKGNQTKANPIQAKPSNEALPDTKRRSLPFPYIGTTLSGALSIVPVPDEKQLAAYTETVYKNCPYSDKLLSAAPYPEKTAIPTKVGDPSPIKYVLYIIKENRTYDQVFGDIKRGNGDPSLVMFGEQVTPNHHKLAEEFVLLDNLYCNGHVSRDGHPWSTMAYNTDWIARDWALTYSRRTGITDDDDGDLEKAPSGYLWDACARAGLTYRSYGEYGHRVSQPDGSTRMEGRVPGLVGHFCPDWGAPRPDGKPVRDTDRAETFLKEFRQYEKDGNLPRFMIMSLGEDHTTGTTPGTYTPQACVASNDLALGRIVEAVSHSKYWPEMAIFVIEDDAQNGPDHVDAHRTVGLVISPYVKRHHLDSTQYQTVSMIRTIELILGLSPLSQFDAAATPMFASFTDRPDLSPYNHEEARIDLEAKNTTLAYGAERSSRMDFSEYDRIDDFELNEILWHAVKGADAPMPPAVRRAIAYRAVHRAR